VGGVAGGQAPAVTVVEIVLATSTEAIEIIVSLSFSSVSAASPLTRGVENEVPTQ
jgi:hypothetical protein